MTTTDFRSQFTKAVNGEDDVDPELQQFWNDFKLTFGVQAAIAHSGGLATLFRFQDDDHTIEHIRYPWADISDELREWRKHDPLTNAPELAPAHQTTV